MRVWVTGICGFLGSHLADALIQDGHVVDGNDNLLCGSKKNVPDKISYTYTDCRNFEAMKAFMSEFKPDVVVHCAATAHEGLSSFSPAFITQNIYEASVSTFSAAIASGVKRIVYMSSMARYGHGYEYCMPPFKEDMPPAPIDPYGIAKVAAEQTLKVLCKTHNVRWSIAVPHNIIGIRQRSVDPYRNVAAIMINRCKQGKPPIIYGDGEQRRCFSPIDDCIPSLLKMIKGNADEQIVNIGPDDNEISIKTLAEKIMKLTNYINEPQYVSGRPNEVKEAFCSSDKARRILGFEEKQSLDDCLKEMVEYIHPSLFIYDFPLEIERGCPETWTKKLI
jgi:UDP-glucose 4-epimerase